MGSSNSTEGIRRKFPSIDIFVKVNHFDYEFLYKYGDVIEPILVSLIPIMMKSTELLKLWIDYPPCISISTRLTYILLTNR